MPRFSLIVPVFDQWHLVPRLLHSLQRQTWTGGEFELLLVDNGSNRFDPPVELPSWVTILHCDTPGSYAARNKGIESARGTWFIFTDADCVPAADWLAQIDRSVSAPSCESRLLAGAINVTVEGSGPPNLYQIYDMVKGIPQAWYVRRGYGATANLCVPRRVMEQIGNFDADRFSGGDVDLCRRAQAHGFHLEYLADAVVGHPARDTWQALVTKARRVKGGQLTAGKPARRALYFARSFAPPVIAAWRFLRQRDQPRRFRVIAVAVQLRIWMVDMEEAVRLGIGMQPE